MNRIIYASVFLFFSFIYTSGIYASSKEETISGKKPNIIFILTDDQGYGDLSCHGNPVLKTPNMDRLHDESVCFTDFMVSPTCAPTRAAIFSGMHEFKSGVSHTTMGRHYMDLNVTTMTEILKSVGYTTGLFGKWHLGLDSLYRPEARGFDVALTSRKDMDYTIFFDPPLARNGVAEKHEGYRTNILFEEALDFIKENKDKPFFCHIPTFSPHAPLDVPAKYSNEYDGNKFLGMVSCVDENIGRLMESLVDLGIDENTLVILINDNGATYGADIWNANMRGVKTTAWYGGTRALSFWRWPNTLIPANVDALTAHVDILPTLAEIAGANLHDETTKRLDGRSLVPLLQASNYSWPERTLFTHVGRWNNGSIDEHKYCQAAVRWNDYTLVRIESCNNPDCQGECRIFNRVRNGQDGYYSKMYGQFNYAFTPQGEWALYNIKSDPTQSINIADGHKAITERLSNQYELWWNEIYPIVE